MAEETSWSVTAPTGLPHWWVPAVTGALALLISVLTVLPQTSSAHRVAYAFNVFGTIAHEFSHAVGGVVTGGGVHLIQVHSPHSGVTHTWYYTRFSAIVTTAAGYALPPLAGLGAASLLARGHSPMVLALTVATMLLIVVVTRDLITFSSVLAVGLLAGAALCWGSAWVQHVVAYTEAWLLLLSQLSGVWFLVLRRINGHDGQELDDSEGLAAATYIPGVVWIATWTALIGWSLWTAAPLLWP